MTKYLKDLYARAGDDPEKVRGYRGGYLPDLRREIEAGLRAGRIEAVAATNALELGIDIGSLDASVLVGWPGTVASAWQQAGRAGRRSGTSLAVLIARNAPVDQYVAEHPEYLFEGSAEAAALDPDNLVIRANHLKCSAFELPFRDGDRFGGAPGTAEILEHLEKRSRILHHDGGLYHWAADAYPAEGVSLNAADVDNFVIHDLDSGRAMGEVDRPSAITEIHPGAVYGLLGDTFLIEKMEWAERRAYARAADLDYYTQALTSTDVRVTRVDREEERGVWRAYSGEVVARTVAPVYKKIRFYTGENVGAGEIHLPEEEMETTAFWFTLDPDAATRAGLLEGDGARALPGLANVLRGVAPLLVRCDPGDVRSACEIRSPLYLRPALFLFDRIPGGVGLAEQLYALHPDLFAAGWELVARCPCEIGCPSCTGPPGEVGADGKRVARAVLAALTGREA
jgi:DEAD/DEAH box helicase domain-containing protein